MSTSTNFCVLQRRQWLALAAGLWLLPAQAARHERRHLFGSPVDLLLPEQTPTDLIDTVWRGLAQMNQRWNAWKPGDVTAVNRAFAAGRAVAPTAAVRGLVQGALAMEALSLGHFNAGIGGLVARWGFHADELGPGPRPPAQELAHWRRVRPSLAQIEHRGNWMRSRNPYLQLDFGGYAKGVALDWALDRLQMGGVQDAVLNLGGNLAAMGGAVERPWQVGVRDPWGSGLMAQLATDGREAVVTSGAYERFRTLDGQRFTHVIDPASAQPVHELISVTVVHPNAALADAAATALLVAGPARWERVAQNMGVTQVLVVGRNGQRQATPALQPRLKWLA